MTKGWPMIPAAWGSVTSTRRAFARSPPAPSATLSSRTSVPMPGTSTRPPGPAATARPSTVSPSTEASVSPASAPSGPAVARADMRIADTETRPSSRVTPEIRMVPSATPRAPSGAAPTSTSTPETLPPPAGRRPPTEAERSCAPLEVAVTAPCVPAGRSAAYPVEVAVAGVPAGAPAAAAASPARTAARPSATRVRRRATRQSWRSGRARSTTAGVR